MNEEDTVALYSSLLSSGSEAAAVQCRTGIHSVHQPLRGSDLAIRMWKYSNKFE
jgi:hypothetical protein